MNWCYLTLTVGISKHLNFQILAFLEILIYIVIGIGCPCFKRQPSTQNLKKWKMGKMELELTIKIHLKFEKLIAPFFTWEVKDFYFIKICIYFFRVAILWNFRADFMWIQCSIRWFPLFQWKFLWKIWFYTSSHY
jgi:hypothetical protein